MDRDEVANCYSARKEHRVPVLSYYNKSNGCSLWRCGQPKGGLFNTKNENDEKLLTEIAKINPLKNLDGSDAGFLNIYDCRPKIAAIGNALKGGGYESNTKTSDLTFCDIGNIHEVRDCVIKMVSIPDNIEDLNSMDKYSPKLEESGYFQMMSYIIKATNNIVKDMHLNGKNILVHCSDGWDRTS